VTIFRDNLKAFSAGLCEKAPKMAEPTSAILSKYGRSADSLKYNKIFCIQNIKQK
jgi:hypothetical protein